uniref:Uncharacterized protein n=1 Tax=Glossina pallidipes TaxID=7398 RepID=A0A1A9ZUW7_GLOPL
MNLCDERNIEDPNVVLLDILWNGQKELFFCEHQTMVSRRKILSRSRDDLNLDQTFSPQEEEEDVWYQKEKLYKNSSDDTEAKQKEEESVDDTIREDVLSYLSISTLGKEDELLMSHYKQFLNMNSAEQKLKYK